MTAEVREIFELEKMEMADLIETTVIKLSPSKVHQIEEVLTDAKNSNSGVGVHFFIGMDKAILPETRNQYKQRLL